MKYILGHARGSHAGEFATKDLALEYLCYTLPMKQGFRYATWHDLDADSIIFSFDGELLAELVVTDKTYPTSQERAEYQHARKVYLIREIRIFQNRTIRIGDLGLLHSQLGTKVPDDRYSRMIQITGEFELIISKQPGLPFWRLQ